MARLSVADAEILEICLKIEEGVSKLYRHFSRVYSDNTQASELWEKTAKEEDSHGEQFRFGMRLSGCNITHLKTNLEMAAAILKKIAVANEAVQRATPTLKDAYRYAINLEYAMAEYHMYSIACFEDENTSRMFKSMMNNDQGHISMLENALEELQ